MIIILLRNISILIIFLAFGIEAPTMAATGNCSQERRRVAAPMVAGCRGPFRSPFFKGRHTLDEGAAAAMPRRISGKFSKFWTFFSFHYMYAITQSRIRKKHGRNPV